jgi:4a-hydroxytetrahydrobiopterin dehydratase
MKLVMRCPTLANSLMVSYFPAQLTGMFTNNSSYQFFHSCVFASSYHPGDLKCLEAAETDLAVQSLPDWTLVKNSTSGDSLTRSFTFDDFKHAFLFMSETAQVAETNQHHPSWTNLYNRVDVTLTTDDKLCLSTFDVELAHAMDYIFALASKK